MLLTSNTVVSFPKLKTIGDTVTGIFISYQENVPSKFGPENLLTLRGDDGKLVIRATTSRPAPASRSRLTPSTCTRRGSGRRS